MTAVSERAHTRSPAATLPSDRLEPFDRRGAVLIATAKAAFHLATATVYGLHRDEFYYLAAGRHPAAGYVDQPPITPLLYRAWSTVFGASERSLHTLPALASVPMILLAAALARDVGGGRWAQRATMVVASVGTVYTTTFHFLSTATVDVLVWGLATWLLLRLVRTGDSRLWVAVGATVGVGFENKHTIVLWCAGVGLGLLMTAERRLLRTRWLAVGIVTAIVIATPNLAWQATHHWASLAFYAALRQRTGTQNMLLFWPTQLGLMTAAGTAFVVAGLRWLKRGRNGESYRVLAIAFVAVVVAFFVTSGKGYYPAGIYLPVVAAGAVALEATATRAVRRRLITLVLTTGVLAAPVFTPILPAPTATRMGLTQVNPDLGGMLGWHDVVNQVAAVYRRLPDEQRASTIFLTRDYSEAASLSYWRSAENLPVAISGHNAEWSWGFRPAESARTIIAVGLPRTELSRYFGTVTPAGTLHGRIDPLQDHLPLWICTNRLAPWPVIWRQLRLYT